MDCTPLTHPTYPYGGCRTLESAIHNIGITHLLYGPEKFIDFVNLPIEKLSQLQHLFPNHTITYIHLECGYYYEMRPN